VAKKRSDGVEYGIETHKRKIRERRVRRKEEKKL
jgi:hypothetical protein